MKKKIALMATSLVLVVAMAVGGTLAYLTSTTDTVTNTFAVGEVAITLDEAKVDTLGNKVDSEGNIDANSTVRVTENSYQLFPGHTYTKDPTIHVGDDSQDCWLFVRVTNDIAGIEAETTIADQMTAKGWNLVTGETNVYAYNAIAKAGQDVVVFDNFKVLGTVTNTQLATYAGKTITVIGYAIQADTFANADAAWTAAQSELGTPAAGDGN